MSRPVSIFGRLKPRPSRLSRRIAAGGAWVLVSFTLASLCAGARVRDYGIVVGDLPPGPLNAITDVAGVRVGHTTIREDDLRTGITVILPHPGNVFQEKVPAAVFVANAFGKFVGLSQVQELGVVETPIALTSTLSIWKVADALAEWVLEQPGNEEVRSVNPVVGECNDGYLSNIRRRAVGREAVRRALAAAHPGPVEEGAVGAGTGTVCLGFKGGIGTASRRLPSELGSWTVGVLVQSNFGGSLTIRGVPVGRLLGRHPYQDVSGGSANRGGSCIIVVATDAPLSSRQLRRLASRAPLGLARVGSYISHGSGDYVLAFSAHPEVRRRAGTEHPAAYPQLADDDLSPLFLAVVEGVEEAVLNSLFAAETTEGWQGRRVEALPRERVVELLRTYRALDRTAEGP
ncbi:MAG: P1 family peptidase [Acidobacteriota bacterium]